MSQPPLFVSPLIRAIRWGLLCAGIVYARGKQKLYNHMEASWKEEEAQRKKIRDANNAILKKKIAEEERRSVKLLESGELFDML